MFFDARRTLFLAASLLWTSGVPSAVTHAQEPIRVEAKEVLVPALVYDEERYRLLQEDTSTIWRAYFAGDVQSVNHIVDGVLIRDLKASDFRLYQDGKEQLIRWVTYEQSLYWNVSDNNGHHTEFIGPGEGKWSTAEWPSKYAGEIDPPYYLIAYAPPESPIGSCHQIKVKVKRRNAYVTTRGQYCNIPHSASDPLSGTRLADQLQSQLASEKGGKVNASLSVVPFYIDSGETRVHVVLDWPPDSFERGSRTIGVLEIVLDKDRNVAKRFSDLFESADHQVNGISGVPHLDSYALARYERQFVVPPGEYDVRAVVSDGKRYGRAEFALTVGTYDRNELAMSAVSLCRQISDMSAYSPGAAPKLPGAWGAKLPGGYVPLLSKGYEYKPTGNTRFQKDETVYTYFEVYEPLLAEQSPPEVKMQVRIVDATTGKMKTDSSPVSATQYVKGGSTTIPIGLGLDISMLPKGSYRLEIRATDSIGKSTAWRTADFSVE